MCNAQVYLLSHMPVSSGALIISHAYGSQIIFPHGHYIVVSHSVGIVCQQNLYIFKCLLSFIIWNPNSTYCYCLHFTSRCIHHVSTD